MVTTTNTKTMKKIFLLMSLLVSFSLMGQSLDMSKLSGMQPRRIGPAGMSGRITAIDVNLQNQNIMFAGAASGGLWRSTDHGISWKPVFDKQPTLSIGCIAIDQKNPDIIWVGTGEGNPRNSLSSGKGIYRSLDGGNTWQLMGLKNSHNIYRIIVSPENSDVVYAGVIGSPWGQQTDRGLYRTTDGGKTWRKILYVNSLTGVADMVMDPVNPRKLFVAMWQHQRWPWFFKSGGPGSGLYVTYDGGDHFEKITAKNGLPKGELGRIGLAVSASNHNVVYALIESKKNGFYRSVDGGKTWQLRTTKNMGGRPFYYADIHVDPKDENTVYTLFTRVNKSIDGGKTFQPLIGRNIHPDHHAWWMSPTNPNFMMEGNDGGLSITYDQGKHWRFVQNLPVGQFYHVSVDMDLPYHVFGGMQDNGSWRGPAYVWARGGIINTYWDNLYGGDGFDVLPDPTSDRYCYAMSQQGYVGRLDMKTGYVKNVRPVHPQGKKLRFNWNAAIAADPFDGNTLYFGSQFLHKSIDRGASWSIISPDLTTNDTAKQHQDISGGLTYDATGAENYTTILAIAPSPVKKGVIWVGTDDGNLQLTTDGGKTWKNFRTKLKGVPQGSWIPQITASRYSAGEAFVVINNYRRNDFTPYLMHTTDFGKTWKSMVDRKKLSTYVLSFAQDPVEPRLMFMGTENGLYFSIDAGETWNQWTNGYPKGLSTMDLVIHPREYDLVIGTFGRAIYILDDIRPLRALAREGVQLLNQPIHAFTPPVAYEVSTKGAPGLFAGGSTYFHGDNRPVGAMISYSVKEGDPGAGKLNSGSTAFAGRRGGGGGAVDMKKFAKAKKVKIQIFDNNGNLVRTLTKIPKTGINRFVWRFDTKGYRFPGRPKPKAGAPEQGGGPRVFPGTYKLVFSYQGQKDSTMLTVKSDPRMTLNLDAMKADRVLVIHGLKKVQVLAEAMDRIKESKITMMEVKKMIPKDKKSTDQVKALRKISKTVSDSLKAISEVLFPDKNIQGIYSNPQLVTNKMRGAYSAIYDLQPLTENQKLALKQTEAIIDITLKRIQQFFDGPWKAYRQAAEKINLSPFNENQPLKVE